MAQLLNQIVEGAVEGDVEVAEEEEAGPAEAEEELAEVDMYMDVVQLMYCTMT